MDMKEFEDAVKSKIWFPGCDPEEWWKSDGADQFISIGHLLVSRGDGLSEGLFSYEEALDVLGMCYSAVSGEYGE